MSNDNSLPEPPVNLATPRRRSFQDFVREHVVPYNNIIAVATFLSIVVGFISPLALAAVGVIVVTMMLQLVAVDLFAKEQMVEWAVANPGTVAALTHAFWPTAQSSIYRAAPFWALVAISIAVVFNAARIAMA